MLDLIAKHESSSLAAIAEAASVADLDRVESDALGKSGSLIVLKRDLGSIPVEERKTAGRALNEARQHVEASLAQRRDELAAVERVARLQAERLDLTEVPTTVSVGHAHIVTQAWEELEDVFVGMGYHVAEGPDVETDWHNFDALNIPPGHPARDGFDTIYVNHGEPGSTLLRTHTSPVQIRTMLTQEPPIYIVAPGRVFRRDTADATHMPVFHQLEGLVIDKGISLADLAGTIQAFTERLLRFRLQLPPAAELLPVHRAVGRVRRPESRRLLAGTRRMRHGPPQRPAGRRGRSGGVVGFRLRVRHRPPRPAQVRRRRPA